MRPGSFFFDIARSRPDIYTQVVLGLYKNGTVRLENLKLESSRLARKTNFSEARISGIDWMIMSSINPSYDKPEDRLSGITWPGNLEKWLTDTGYQVVDKRLILAGGWIVYYRLSWPMPVAILYFYL